MTEESDNTGGYHIIQMPRDGSPETTLNSLAKDEASTDCDMVARGNFDPS